MAIKLIAGLGNPGEEYEGTRHNAGFIVVDALAAELGARYWKSEDGALVAHVGRGRADGGRGQAAGKGGAAAGDEELLLAKPQSYMNTSGGPLSKLMRRYSVKPEELLVVHDDLDLEPGRIRVKVGGGNAGHNGLKSIQAKLGTNGYARVRIGIGHPPGKKPVADFVLQRPRGADAENFEAACDAAARAALCVAADGPVAAMNKFN